MRILFVAPYVPSLIRVRPFHFIKHLSALGHEITVVALSTDEPVVEDQAARDLANYCTQVLRVPHSKSRAALQCAAALVTPMPLWAAYCRSQAMMSKLERIAAAETFDVGHVEHLRAAHFAAALPRLPLVYDSVDCITRLQGQFARSKNRSLTSRLLSWEEHAKLRRYEPMAASGFRRVLVTSPEDAGALAALGHESGKPLAIEVVPNGVDSEYFRPVSEISRTNGRENVTIVMTGKMSYGANSDGALYFLKEIFPLVLSQIPEARFVVAGSGPPAELLEYARRQPGQVDITGYVPDLRPSLARAAVAVCPLRIGVGIQNKVLEAMAMGKPVVATPLAAGAFPAVGAGIAVASDAPAFAREVVRLLRSRADAERMGAEARRYVETHHDWSAVARKLVTVYEEARGRSAS